MKDYISDEAIWRPFKKFFSGCRSPIKKILVALGILFAFALGLGVIVIAPFLPFFITMLVTMGVFDKDYSVSELKKNFYSRETEILELKRYYDSIVPYDKSVVIEFENSNRLGRFFIYDINPSAPSKNKNGDWDIKVNSDKADSLLNIIGWKRNNLRELKKKLSNAHCIGISGGEPTTIDFRRSGMGMYSFNIFNNPIPDSLKNRYNDSCRYILVNDKLALEYGGGVWGPQCFYKLR
jgi:hypothetical protein